MTRDWIDPYCSSGHRSPFDASNPNNPRALARNRRHPTWWLIGIGSRMIEYRGKGLRNRGLMSQCEDWIQVGRQSRSRGTDAGE
jgi:hypothetical protein